MTDYTRLASVFIVSLGMIFIFTGILLTVVFEMPPVLGVATVIVGIFLSLLPLTRDRYR